MLALMHPLYSVSIVEGYTYLERVFHGGDTHSGHVFEGSHVAKSGLHACLGGHTLKASRKSCSKHIAALCYLILCYQLIFTVK